MTLQYYAHGPTAAVLTHECTMVDAAGCFLHHSAPGLMCCFIAVCVTCQPWNGDAGKAHHVYPDLLAGSPLWPLVGLELLEWLLAAVAATPGGCARPLWLAHSARCVQQDGAVGGTCAQPYGQCGEAAVSCV